MCEIVVVQDAAPRFQRFVGREDHRAMPSITLVDDVEEHVRGVGAVRERAHFIDGENDWLRVRLELVRPLAGAKVGREIVPPERIADGGMALTLIKKKLSESCCVGKITKGLLRKGAIRT